MIIYFVYFSFDIFIFILFNSFYFYLYLYMYSLISQFPNFSQLITAIFIKLNFYNYKFAFQNNFCLISRVGWFVAFGDSVSTLTVTDDTEIHQMAGVMGRLYTRGTRENWGRRRIDWLNSSYYMVTTCTHKMFNFLENYVLYV